MCSKCEADNINVENPQIEARVKVAYVENINVEDTHIVWFSYVLGSWRAMVGTKALDGRYYEVVYDLPKRVTYVNTYKEFDQVSIVGQVSMCEVCGVRYLE